MLTGSELLARVKELGDASKSELVRATGYVSSKEDGTERLNFTAFYEALLEAKGVSLGRGSGESRPGRRLSYITRVQFNGNLQVGQAYTAQLGLEPGAEFEIQLGRRLIKLVPLDAPHDPEEAATPAGEDSGLEQPDQPHPQQEGAEQAPAPPA